MGKFLKYMLVFLLAGAVMALGAAAPALAARFRDGTTVGKTASAAIGELTLEIQEPKTEVQRIQEKLALYSMTADGDEYVEADKAQRTADAVIAICQGEVERYREAGALCRDWFCDEITATPVFRYALSPETGTLRSGIFWYVHMVFYDYDPNGYRDYNKTMMMAVDDETGRILSVEYNDPTWSFGMEENGEMNMDTFCDLYFTGLGVEPEVFQSYRSGNPYELPEDTFAWRGFSWEDPDAGQRNLLLCIGIYGYCCVFR